MKMFRPVGWWVAACAMGTAAQAQAQAAGNTVVYRCPGNVYTDAISAKEAKDKGCRVIEGAPVTVIQSTKPREGKAVPASGLRPAEAKVDPDEQRARDGDARRLVEWIRATGPLELLHVNLIIFNKTATPHEATPEQNARRFQAKLLDAGVKATVRQNLGRDIQGACGQLIVSERESR